MKRFANALIASAFILALPSVVSAQAADAALSEAKARLACGTGTVLSAKYLPNGSVEVTCQSSPPDTQSSALDGTGLSTPAAVGVGSAIVVLGIAIGGDDGTTATTSSTLP